MPQVREADLERLDLDVRSMKNRMWWVGGILFVPLATGAVWAYGVGTTAKANSAELEDKATKVEVEQVQETLKEHAKGINWIGQAVESIARQQNVDLSPRPIVPEQAD